MHSISQCTIFATATTQLKQSLLNATYEFYNISLMHPTFVNNRHSTCYVDRLVIWIVVFLKAKVVVWAARQDRCINNVKVGPLLL